METKHFSLTGTYQAMYTISNAVFIPFPWNFSMPLLYLAINEWNVLSIVLPLLIPKFN